MPREYVCAMTVLDVGWNARELSGHPGWLTITPATVDLLVTRASAAAALTSGPALARTHAGQR